MGRELSWGFEKAIGPPRGVDAISQGSFRDQTDDEAKGESRERAPYDRLQAFGAIPRQYSEAYGNEGARCPDDP
jgi:hypothetical protein